MSKYKAQMEYVKRKDLVKIAINDKRSIRDEFKRVCEENNTKYNTVLRRFIYEYIVENGGKIE